MIDIKFIGSYLKNSESIKYVTYLGRHFWKSKGALGKSPELTLETMTFSDGFVW